MIKLTQKEVNIYRIKGYLCNHCDHGGALCHSEPLEMCELFRMEYNELTTREGEPTDELIEILDIVSFFDGLKQKSKEKAVYYSQHNCR